MADYYSLLNRATLGLPEQSLEARRAVYERARAALTRQLLSIEPALSEADITRERLALEEAVRRNEQELAKAAMIAHTKPLDKTARLEKPQMSAPSAKPLADDSSALEKPTSEKIGFEKPSAPLKLPPLPELKTAAPASTQQNRVRFDMPLETQKRNNLWLIIGGICIVLGSIIGLIYFFAFPNSTPVSAPTTPSQTITSTQPPAKTAPAKSAERVPTDQEAKASASQSSAAAVLESKVIFFEEAQTGMNANTILQGQIKWALETVNAANAPADTAVVARITVPERKMTVEMRLRRNLDQTLPASHTIELNFNYPLDANTTAIANIPGILMKTGEQTRGQPLAGLAVKVTGNFFLIGLSSSDADMIRNVQFLKDWSWFDIPIEFENRRRAILSLEKGVDGERIINEALAQWAR